MEASSYRKRVKDKRRSAYSGPLSVESLEARRMLDSSGYSTPYSEPPNQPVVPGQYFAWTFVLEPGLSPYARPVGADIWVATGHYHVVGIAMPDYSDFTDTALFAEPPGTVATTTTASALISWAGWQPGDTIFWSFHADALVNLHPIQVTRADNGDLSTGYQVDGNSAATGQTTLKLFYASTPDGQNLISQIGASKTIVNPSPGKFTYTVPASAVQAAPSGAKYVVAVVNAALPNGNHPVPESNFADNVQSVSLADPLIDSVSPNSAGGVDVRVKTGAVASTDSTGVQLAYATGTTPDTIITTVPTLPKIVPGMVPNVVNQTDVVPVNMEARKLPAPPDNAHYVLARLVDANGNPLNDYVRTNDYYTAPLASVLPDYQTTLNSLTTLNNGTIKLTYTVAGATTPTSKTPAIDLVWAEPSGDPAMPYMKVPGTSPVADEQSLRLKKGLQSAIFSADLSHRPAGATGILAVLDYNNEVTETTRANNLAYESLSRYYLATASLTAYRPATPYLPAVKVPADTAHGAGAGIRLENDPDGSPNPIDLVRIDLALSQPAGADLDYKLRLGSDALRVYPSPSAPPLEADPQTGLIDLPANATRIYVEWAGAQPGTSTVSVFAHDPLTDDLRRLDSVNFTTLHSAAVIFAGETQPSGDPSTPTGSPATTNIAKRLYAAGYDVWYFAPLDDVNAVNDIEHAAANHGLTDVALIGYSHGGGAVYDVSQRLATDQAASFQKVRVDYAAYIDAVSYDDTSPFSVLTIGPEQRYPVGALQLRNFYEHKGIVGVPAGPGGIHGGAVVPPVGSSVTTRGVKFGTVIGGNDITAVLSAPYHFTIQDNNTVRTVIVNDAIAALQAGGSRVVTRSDPPSTTDAPTGLTAPAVGVTTATLAWNAVPAATGYTVQASTDGGDTWNDQATFAATGGTLNVTAATAYQLRVVADYADDDDATGDPSAPIAVNTPTPAPPTDFRVTATDTSSISVAFTPSPSGGHTRIALSTDNVNFDNVAVTDDSTFTIGGLATGATYYLKARDDLGGVYSDYTRTLTAATNLPAPPADLRVTATGTTSLTVAFTPSPSGGHTRIALSTDNVNFDNVAVTDASTFTVGNLTPGVTYYLKARDDLAGAYSDYTRTLTATTLLPVPPGDFRVTAVGTTSVTVAFSPSTSGGHTRVALSTDNVNFDNVAVTDDSSFTIGNLTPGVTYYLKARDDLGGGYSDYTRTLTATTVLPLPPTNFRVTATDTSSVTVAFSPPATGGLTRIALSTDNVNFDNVAVTDGSTFTVGNLTPGVTYYLKARSDLGGIYSDYTHVLTATTNLPTPPGGFRVTGTDASSITLAFTPSPSGGHTRIALSTDNVNFDNVAVTDASTFTVGNLTPGATYYLKARDDLGGFYSDYTGTLTAATVPPAKLTNLVAARNDATPALDVVLTWAIGGGAISGINVARSTDGVNFDRLTTINGAGTSFTDTANLIKGTRYYYEVRAFVIVNGVTYYGSYSNVDAAIPR